MNVSGDLPAWAVLVIALVAALALVLLNIGWLLSAKSMLDAQRRRRERDTSDPDPKPPLAPGD
ncbi:MAG TPA: hypothetical protein VEQ11_09525 [Chloroflexota bacterium]|nr:hypothetical protein [Chloroflexota bacterium]